MKKLLTILAMAISTVAMAEMSLGDARGKIGDAIRNPAVMAEIMKGLNATNQVAFLEAVNEAVSVMRASPEEKAAKFVELNEIALQNAQKGNLKALLAETFATVPPEYLTILNERFAADLFNRNADPTNPISDADFVRSAADAMAAISERVAGMEDAAVRDTFATLMFVRASEGTIPNLAETLIDASISDTAARDKAKSEWIPAATSPGIDQTYEPMLGDAGAEEAPAADQVVVAVSVPSTEGLSSLLSDLGSSDTAFSNNASGVGREGTTPETSGSSDSTDRVPLSDDPRAPWSPDSSRGRTEPDGYFGQRVRR